MKKASGSVPLIVGAAGLMSLALIIRNQTASAAAGDIGPVQEDPDPDQAPAEVLTDDERPIVALKIQRPAPLTTAAVPPVIDSATERDIEAGARMLASENPRGSERLQVEILFTQIRQIRKNGSLYSRITAASGFGPQGERAGTGGRRPVATSKPATDAGRQLTREVLAGRRSSALPQARKFFEPAVQDRAFAIAERARSKLKAGQPLTKQEQRLKGYHFDAAALRAKWRREGSELLDDIEGVEFFT